MGLRGTRVSMRIVVYHLVYRMQDNSAQQWSVVRVLLPFVGWLSLCCSSNSSTLTVIPALLCFALQNLWEYWLHPDRSGAATHVRFLQVSLQQHRQLAVHPALLLQRHVPVSRAVSHCHSCTDAWQTPAKLHHHQWITHHRCVSHSADVFLALLPPCTDCCCQVHDLPVRAGPSMRQANLLLCTRAT
jgi:hypothetical protein